jgi:hypothetical protein
MVDSSSNGSLTTRTIDGAWELFERMASTSAMWSSDRVVPKKSAGVYEVNTYSALSAKIDSLFHKVDSISQTANSAQVKKQNCEECGANHNTSNCPILAQGMEQVEYAQWSQHQHNNPQTDTYNPGWKNHPNFSWGGNQYQNQNQNHNRAQGQFQQEKKPQLEEMFAKLMEKTDKYMETTNQFMRKTETNFQIQGAAIKNLETQVGQIAHVITSRLPGALPSNTETNPKEQVMAIRILGNEGIEDPSVNAITTRSGVQLPEIHVKRPAVSKETIPTSDEEQVEQTEQMIETSTKESSDTPRVKATVPINPYEPPIPFPQRLKKHQRDQQFEKFLDMLRKLHINIPFVDAIRQIPSYAKFLKDMISKKKKLLEYETVALTEESSARLQKKLPPKLKDPGSFTLPISIGEAGTFNALCDTGASINLMPLSIFRKLGVGEAKATTVTLQLADRSLTHPRGIIEDVLIKVGKFIFPADFLILDIEEDRNIPIILGRPFLRTGRTLIDMEKCELILRVDDEQEVFTLYSPSKQPSALEECQCINEDKLSLQQNCQKKKPKLGGLLGRDENGEFKVWRANRGCKAGNCKVYNGEILRLEPP